ncbi:MAG TPA: VWA domain-containing protein [Actinobacteria bacterium]|nr:VWA domain-containing protein [Actinomycetota bacterium]
MIESLGAFVEELRAIGIPVSLVEALDAAQAVEVADLTDREGLRSALGATLVKSSRHRPAFDAVFDVFFGHRLGDSPSGPDVARRDETAGRSGTGGGAGEGADALREGLVAALVAGDETALRALVAEAVTRFGAIEAGRPVAGRYARYRVFRALDLERVASVLGSRLGAEPSEDPLDGRLAAERVRRLLDALRRAVEAEILRRLVADRGPVPVARTTRPRLDEDLDLLHASHADIARIERALAPLARRLATRISGRRRHGERGRLDVRRTIRRSLAHGGVFLEPRFRKPRPSKPDLVLLCDVSGSMATFARFTMQLTAAIAGEFSRVRVFAFIEDLDEVTEYFDRSVDFATGLAAMYGEAELVRLHGHSDYGRSLATFVDRHLDVVTPKTSVLVTGDARTNYRDPGLTAFATIAKRARAVFWLNPEPRRHWDTGDSVMSLYAEWCDEVAEVRSLRQLERFVEAAALPRRVR